MIDPVLLVSVDCDEDERTRVTAPAVGWWIDQPRPGAALGPSASAGVLRRLNRRFSLRLPDGVTGRVERVERAHAVAVEFGETLFHLVPFEAGSDTGQEHAEQGAVDAAGTLEVVAPTDGVFYSRPAPDSPPFVEPGQRIRSGQPIGLIEIMKTFSQILYGGPGLPDEAEVVELRCADGTEVSSGQALITVR